MDLAQLGPRHRTGTCTVPDCGRIGRITRGWCVTHYSRWLKSGTLDDPRPSTQERFAAKATEVDGCHVWTGSRTSDGYGNFWDGERSWLAHRWSYTQSVGPIPDGLTLDHICRNRACVNPRHLEPVTQAENTLRGGPATKTHCKNGHPYTPANTYRRKADGRRDCRACRKARSERQYAKTKQQKEQS